MRQHYSNKTKTDAGGAAGGYENARARPSDGLSLTFTVTPCLPAHVSAGYSVHKSQIYACTRHIVDSLMGLTSAQVHLCAAAVRVAVNPALVHSSRGADRAAVGRVGLGCPHDHPADMRHRERDGSREQFALLSRDVKLCFQSHGKLLLLGNNAIWIQNITDLDNFGALLRKKNVNALLTAKHFQ